MNTNLFNIIKQFTTKYGESVLSEPKRVNSFLLDLAQDVPKAERNALIKCLEHKFAQILQNADKDRRDVCKQKLAEELHKEEGLDKDICKNTIELLATVLFGAHNTNIHSTLTDTRDGRQYKTVKIGEQIWMAENLNYDRLYDWETAQKACPPGWHLPTIEEWQTLINYVGGKKIAAKKLKATDGWKNDKEGNSGNGTDDYGFSALPCGRSDFNDPKDNEIIEKGHYGYWWSGSKYVAYHISKYDTIDHKERNKSCLFSVRCVKD